MTNQTKKQQVTNLWALSLMSILCLSIFILSACGNQAAESEATDDTPVQTEEDADVSTIETDEDQTVSPAVEADASEENMNETVVQNETDPAASERSDLNVSLDQKIKFMFEDMTFVRLVSEENGHAVTVCAGTGLKNIEPLAEGPAILIPNAGDLSVDGSNVAIKMTPDGEITFIPRTAGQRIRVPIDVGDKKAGKEVLSLSLAEARQLAATGNLIWTADGLGPYGTGQGLAGHIADCDPL